MRTTIAVLLATSLLPGIAAPPARAEEAPAGLRLGDPAPLADVKMKDVDGRELSIGDVRGPKGTLVFFSCNHCPWVKAWEKRMVALGNGYAKRGVGVVAINSNDPAVAAADDLPGMQARARERGMNYAYVVDATSNVARAFGATHTPEAFLFDAAGRLVYHGAIDDNAKQPGEVKSRYLENALKAVVAGKPVPVAETKSLGCTIKFRKQT